MDPAIEPCASNRSDVHIEDVPRDHDPDAQRGSDTGRVADTGRDADNERVTAGAPARDRDEHAGLESDALEKISPEPEHVTQISRKHVRVAHSRGKKRSKTVAFAFGEFSARNAPTSRMKPTAISIESSVGRSRRRTSIWRAMSSCATPWLTRCAMKVVVEWHTI